MINSKVVIIGDGMVGSSIAFTMLQQETVNDLVIIDVNKSKAEGDALDLMQGLPFVTPKKVRAGEYKDIKDAHVVIITAGVAQKDGETRLDLLKKNLAIFDSIISMMKPYLDDEAIVLVVTNPVDILSYFTYKKLGISANRVIGSGTVLDTARLKTAIAEHTHVDPRNVHTFVIGEHGDSEVATYSVTTIGGIPISKYCLQCGACEDGGDKILLNLHEEVKKAAYEIIAKKGSTYYAVALAVNFIVKAIVDDYSSVLTVSTYIENDYDGKIKDVYLSLPCIVGRKGIKRVLYPNYSELEIEKLIKSADILKSQIELYKNS
jgi:L-lactate dehydrogenase